MKICCCWLYAITKYGYPPSIKNTYNAINDMARLGFKFIELEGGVQEKNLLDVDKNKEALKKRCDDLGLKVINFCPVLPNCLNLNPKKRKKALALFDMALDIASFFGVETIQLDTYSPPLKFVGEMPYKDAIKFGKVFKVKSDPKFSWQALWNVIVDVFKKCNEKAKSRGLELILEPRVGENVSNTDAMIRLLEAVGSENFGVVFDTGHLNAQKEILPLSIEKLGNRIKYLHVSDNDGRDNLHLPLGKGTVDWNGVFAALKKHGFDGYVGIDVGNVPNIDKAYLDSKRFLERIRF